MSEIPIIEVLIADDHAMFRSGLRAVLETQPDITCVAEASNGYDAVSETLRLRPTVAIIDLRMPKLDGVGATTAIAAANSPTRVLILTTYDDETSLQQAIRAGARGYILKSLPPEEMSAAVRIAARGDAIIDPSMLSRLAPRLADRFQPPSQTTNIDHLTVREVEVIKLIAEAMTNAEIAAALGISEETVKTHVSRILAKLGLRDRIQAAVFAHRNHLAG